MIAEAGSETPKEASLLSYYVVSFQGLDVNFIAIKRLMFIKKSHSNILDRNNNVK